MYGEREANMETELTIILCYIFSWLYIFDDTHESQKLSYIHKMYKTSII